VTPSLGGHFLDLPPWTGDAETLACRMRSAARVGGPIVRSRSGVWSVILSKDEYGWIFSARCLGSTVEDDWRYLGKIVAAMGAPEAVPESVRTSPSGVHRWMWSDVPLSPARQRERDEQIAKADRILASARRPS
jgi:hypothetical protein